ncbi:malonyl-CoA O-methyltransferase [Gracilimonas mengyeensis]|uniref:Malonyl-CoA O-methyltransferase n=2 Tax=Gracilimonas mengyeensis TaxID=1302730 RepID=A0A521AHA2_9BACT|nr:malonyl-CoA O-methyltransferase [Gracilimonas mengyeensis]
MSSLIPWQGMLPDGPILEVGCRTGFLTEKLLRQFPEREFLIMDSSSEMLAFCKQRLDEEGLLTDKVRFQLLSSDFFSAEGEERFAMIVSNFAVHWQKDTSLFLQRSTDKLLPGGLILCSFPGNHSYPDWYEHCLKLGLPHTANPLPDVEEVAVKLSMGPMQIDYYENDLYQEFDSSLDFFLHLKRIGAAESTLGKSLNYKQFKLLTDHWDKQADDKVKIKWHIVYLAGKKDLI